MHSKFNYKILVVDDSKTALAYIDEALGDLPVQIIKQDDPLQAKLLLQQEDINIVISDIDMPKLNGFELLESIQNSPQTKDIPVIFMSARYTQFEDIEKSYNMGIIDFILKPLNKALLIAKIKGYFKILDSAKLKAESDLMIRDILNSQSNLVLITNGKKPYSANKPMLKFFGIDSIEELRDSDGCLDNFFVEGSGYVAKEKDGISWLDVLNKDVSKQHKVQIRDLNQDIRIFQISTNGKKLEYDKDELYVVTLTDITELERLRYNLNEQVQEQVAQLKQQQQTLTEQSRLAAMGEMIANISHQWKQPLSTLSYMIQKLQFQPIESKEKSDELVEKALPQIDYLANTIEDFRTFFIEDKNNHNFKIDDAISGALSIVGKTLENKQIEVKIEANNSFEVYGKQNTFAQVVINILNNAKDILVQNNIANPKVVIEYGIKDNINYITIKDNAGGISDDVLPKIFEPYFTTKFKDQGTGIGLYMSKMIIENQMGGNLNASNIDNGALFTINFKKED